VWTVDQAKLGFAMAFLLGACANFYELLLGVFIVWCFLFQAHEMISRASTSRVIVALPLSRHELATNFWAVAIVAVPFTFAAGHLTYIALKANVGTPSEFSTALMVKRGLFVMGSMASFSMMQAFYSWHSGEAGPISVRKQSVYLIPAVLMVAISIAFAWQVFSTGRQFVMQDTVPVVAAFVLSWTSFHYANLVWCSRIKSRVWQLSKLAVLRGSDTAACPSNRTAACFKIFWSRYARIGGGLWGMLVGLIASVAYLEGSSISSLDPEILTVFLCLSIVPIAFLAPISIPNIRSFRMLPLSRKRLTLLLLSFPFSFSVPAVVLAPTLLHLIGFAHPMNLSVILLMAAVHLVLAIAALRWGYRVGMFAAAISMFIVPIIFLATTLWDSFTSTGAIVLTALLFMVASVVSTYYLIGNSSRVYQRKSPLEEIIAMRQQQ
jgi:hypothetical protein